MSRILLSRAPTALTTVIVGAVLLGGCTPSVATSAAPHPAPTTSARPTTDSATPASPTQTPSAAPVAATAPSTPSPAAAGTALALLDTLPVKGRAPMTAYTREEFGQAWLDANRNGCDTRNDMLTRDLTARVYEAGTDGCVVLEGDLADPYTARTIHFVRGDGDLVDIDHVVALGNAWATGAYGWPIRKRAALANDPMNLLSVDASANRQKGDGDAATWLPSNKGYRCAYVARQVAVKAKYQLWVTVPERGAMARVLASCPTQLPPADSGAPVLVTFAVADPAQAHASAPSSAPAASSSGQGSVWYENCDAARAAGAAPVYRGDPGYDSHLDRDGDGVACE